MPLQLTPYTLKAVVQETPDVKTFTFQAGNDQHVDFKPGQYVMLYWKMPDGKTHPREARAYSIASPPGNSHIELTIKIKGYFSQKLNNLKGGEAYFMASQPMGFFFFEPERMKEVVMLAGGVGIAPFRSIVKYCTDNKLPTKLTVIFSNKHSKDIIYEKEWAGLAAKNPNLRVINTLTQDKPEGWTGETGRITEEMLKKYVHFDATVTLADNPERYFMLCGSNEFVLTLETLLQQMGVPKAAIKKELFGNGI